MDEKYEAIFPDLLKHAQEILAASPACHDWDHTLRVLANARHLAAVEGADAAVVEYAAVLHDIGRPGELADSGRSCHAEQGAEMAAELLSSIGIEDTEFIAKVAACVLAHRYRRRNGAAPRSIEEKVVFDADKLDCIGAVGIGRAFHFAGRIGARVHNTREQALGSASYSREDSAYREYLVKLQHVHEQMLTGEGKRIARSRNRFMVDFFDRICCEVRGEDYG